MGTLTKQQIEQRMLRLISDYADEKINRDDPAILDRVFSSMGLDSLDSVELVIAAEDEFNIDIPDESWKDVDTPRKAIDLVSNIVR